MLGKDPLEDVLRTKGIAPGDYVEVASSDGRVVRGVLMPHHEFSGADILTVKLDNGYNVGVRPGGEGSISLIKKADQKPADARAKVMASVQHKASEGGEPLPQVSIVSTGGTIASYVDYRTGAVKPAITADELARSVPELTKVCSPRPEVLYSVLSENMRPENWRNLAERVADHLNGGSRGCIVPHGTDTMGYTSAALSFSLTDLTGPVVLVGSQRSSDRPSSDSTLNLLSAVQLCVSSDLGEVVVLMHATPDDDRCSVHRGTRVRKCHSSRRDAFESVNEPPIGFVKDNGVVLDREHERRGCGKVKVDGRFDEGVAMLNFYPGLTAPKLRKYADGASGLIIAGTGLGHVHQDLIREIARLTGEGVPVCITTQCIWGSANLNVYSTGRDMLKAGAIPLGDMLSETAYVKLSWVLGHTKDAGKCREMMLTNMRREIGERRPL